MNLNIKSASINYFVTFNKSVEAPKVYIEASRFLEHIFNLEKIENKPKINVFSVYNPLKMKNGLIVLTFSILADQLSQYFYLEQPWQSLKDYLQLAIYWIGSSLSTGLFAHTLRSKSDSYISTENCISLHTKINPPLTQNMIHEGVHFLAKNKFIHPLSDSFLARAIEIFYLILEEKEIPFDSSGGYSKEFFDLGDGYMKSRNVRGSWKHRIDDIFNKKIKNYFFPIINRFMLSKSVSENYFLGMFVAGLAKRIYKKYGFNASVIFFQSLANGVNLEESIDLSIKKTDQTPEFKTYQEFKKH